MRKNLNKIFCLLMTAIIIAISPSASLSVQAATNDFTMKKFDKAYITFVFDDGKMPFSKQCYQIFKDFKMPMCCALISDKIKADDETANFFKKIEAAGCEILSHTSNHDVLHQDNCNINTIEKLLADSYRVLTALGFNVNGIIETGNGGQEATADYELIETVSRKYYKYSNAYGISPQYKKERIWLKDNTLDSMKSLIDKAINEKEWLVISAHDFTEFSKEDMTKLLKYIDSKGKSKAEVVTWNYVYKTFGKYTGPKVPTKEAIESVCKTQGHNLSDIKIKKKATCTKNAVEEGKCKICGKVETREVYGTAEHKFGEYLNNSNATCQELATKIAKCTVKGCNATSVIYDTKGGYKPHSYYPVAVKESTDDTTGLAENKCEYCGKVKNTIIIPKGKTIYDIIYEQSVSSQNQSSADASESEEQEVTSETESEEQTSSEEKENTVVEESDFENDKMEGTVAIVLIVVVAVLCVALWGGIGYFVYKNIKKQEPED